LAGGVHADLHHYKGQNRKRTGVTQGAARLTAVLRDTIINAKWCLSSAIFPWSPLNLKLSQSCRFFVWASHQQ
jgi:hypothetical protein